MEGPSPVIRGQRRLPAWMAWAGIASGLLCAITWALWLLLPRWMPVTVIRWSPWVEPVLRAVTCVKAYSHDFDERVDAWGAERLPAFAQALRSGGVGVRCEAIRGLCQFAYRPNLRPVVIPMLFAALADQDRTVLIATLASLGGLVGDRDQPPIPGLAQRLAPFLRSDDAEVRQEAVIALELAFGASREELAAIPLLLATLTDTRPDVRDAAAAAIAHIQDSRAAQIIIATLGAPDVRLRRAAVEAAGAIQMSEMIQPLSRLYETADADMRATILRAFFNIGDYTTVPFIIRASVDPDREVRLLAVRRLVVFAEFLAGTDLDGKRELAEAITVVLRDGDGEVAAAARVAAAHLTPTTPTPTPAQRLPGR